MQGKKKLQPNIVFILADDLGSWALGCAGNNEVQTPNIDRLAREGMRFDNFFCTSPVCSPARASILTGRIPSSHGVLDYLKSGNFDRQYLKSAGLDHMPIFSHEKEPIEYLKGQLAYTDILVQEGYTCGLSGKWHLGDQQRKQKSFSHWYTTRKGYFGQPAVRDGHVVIEKDYITDLITADALNFIDNQIKDEVPFYASIHHHAPHSPWGREDHPSRFFDLYEDCPFDSVPFESQHSWTIGTCPSPENSTERRGELLKGYFASITAMDEGIGKILDRLDEGGIRKNTVVIFMSDNGMNMGHHGIWGKGNGTFPLNMYDTSVKVPAIISRPGHIPCGVVNRDLLSQYDIMPTILDYLGYNQVDGSDLPGISFASLLRGGELKKRENVVVFDEYGPVRMVRSTDWKYVHRYPYGPNELYNLKEDPNEEHNLVADPDKAAKIKELKGILDIWFHRYTDPGFDGTKEAVSGLGQLGLAGPSGKGAVAFFPMK